MVIGLIGPLGAGKTHLVKGIASGNAGGDAVNVTSPTFTLVHQYPGRLTLYHVDVYRLRGANELFALGFEEWIGPAGVIVVEWADRVRDVIGREALWIEMAAAGESQRLITLEVAGEAAVDCLARLVSVRFSER